MMLLASMPQRLMESVASGDPEMLQMDIKTAFWQGILEQRKFTSASPRVMIEGRL